MAQVCSRSHSSRVLATAGGVCVAGLVLASSSSTAYASYVGNSLAAGSFDSTAGAFYILGEFNSNGPNTTASASDTFPTAGTVNDVDLYAPTGATAFVIYDLRLTSTSSGNPIFTVEAKASLTTISQSAAGVETISVPGADNFNVQAGDLLAYYAPGAGAAAIKGLTSSGSPNYDSNLAANDGADAGYCTSSGNSSGSGGMPALTVGTAYAFQSSSPATSADTTFYYPTGYGPARLYSIGVDYTATPEPTSLSLVAIWGGGLLLRRRRRALGANLAAGAASDL